MDHSFQQQDPGSDLRKQHRRLANRLHTFESLLSWLVNLFQLTEAEQDDAGVYFGDPLTNTYQYSQDSDNKENYHGQ